MRGVAVDFCADDVPERVRARLWPTTDTNLTLDDCWPAENALQGCGYSQLKWRDENGDQRVVLGHRLAYAMTTGPIPAGFDVDHRCRNRACRRPKHLRLRPLRENRADQVHPRRAA